MTGYQRTVVVLLLVANVLLTITKAQWLYQYPSQTHNWRRKLPHYNDPSPDRSYQILPSPSNQPVRSHESMQSSAKFPIQMHQTPYYSPQQLDKLNPATHQPTETPATLLQPAQHLTPKPVKSQEPVHNTTRSPVKLQRLANESHGEANWPQQPVRSQQPTNQSTMQLVTSQQPTHHLTQQGVTSQQSTRHPPQQPIRSQQPTNYPSQQPIRSHQPTNNPSQQPIRSQQPTNYPSQQPIRPQQPTNYPSQQPIRSQQPKTYPSQQLIRSQQPKNYPSQQPIRSQHPTNYPQQPIRSQQPTNYPQQPIRSQQPINYLSQQPIRSQQPKNYPSQQPIRSQQPTNYPQQPIRSQQPINYPSQQPIRSQQPTNYPQQPIRSQQPINYPSQQPIRSQQPKNYPSQQPIRSQPTNYPQQPIRSKQPTNYPQQPIRSQQLTHHLNHQSIGSRQPTRHQTHQSIGSQQSKYHISQQPIKSMKPAHPPPQHSIRSWQPAHPPTQESIRSQQPAHHPLREIQYQQAQPSDRRHQLAWYWNPYEKRYHQQWPQSIQAPNRPGQGKRRFDPKQVQLSQTNTSITDSTSSPSPNSPEAIITRTQSTNTPITPSNLVTTTEKTTLTTNLPTTSSTTMRTIIGISSAIFPMESKPDTITPTTGITSTSPSTRERTKVKVPVTTRMATTSFVPMNTFTTSKPRALGNSKDDDLKNASTAYTTTVIRPAVTDTDTNTTTTTSSPWPFTMKPVQLIIKTQKYIPNPLPTDNTQDISYMNGNIRKSEEDIVGESLNLSTAPISVSVSQNVCCESKFQKRLFVEESHNVTEMTDITTLLPQTENYGSDIKDDIPQYNHDLLPHENTATIQYPIEKALILLPDDDNTTHLYSAKDITVSLPSLSISPHGESSTSPPSSKRGDSLLSRNNDTFPQSLNEKDNLPPKLLTDDNSTSPVEGTVTIFPKHQQYLSSQSTWRGYAHPNPTKVVNVAFGQQTARDPSQSHSPLELQMDIKYPYQREDGQKEAIIPPAHNQTLPKKDKGPPPHSQQKSPGPQKLPVQQTSFPPRLLRPGFLRYQHLNRPSPSRKQPMQTNNPQGILPQFNPASGLKFEVTKLRETSTERNTKDVLPQFNPTSGLIFSLRESTDRTNTVHSESNGEINDAPLELQPDPFHTAASPTLHKHLDNGSYNSEVITEKSKIHENNLHRESLGLFPGHERNLTSWKNEANIQKTADEQLSYKMEENPTTPMPLLNTFDVDPISLLHIKTPQANSSSSKTLPVMSTSSVQTSSEVAETVQEATITPTSLIGTYENFSDDPSPMFAGFLYTKTELMDPENHSNIQSHADRKNKNPQDSHVLSHAKKGFVEPVPLDAANTTNTEGEGRMELGNTSTKSILIQNMEKLEETAVILPYMSLFHSVVPSQKRFSPLNEGKRIVTGAKNPTEAMVSSRDNSRQRILPRPPYLQGFAQGLRQEPVLDQSISSSQQQWRPIYNKTSPATPFLSESLDPLLVRQSDKTEVPNVQPTSSVSITPHDISTAMTIPTANEQKLSSIIKNDEKLVSDILSALPDSFRGSVRVDRANLHNHNNVAVSDSYGNVIYQQGGITFIGKKTFNSNE